MVAPVLLLPLASCALAAAPPGHLPWAPLPPDSPQLLAHLRNTSRPKLSYSTYIGWYEDGGLNETALFAQVQAMATQLRPHGWDSILHDYGWQVCGSTYHVHDLANGTLGSGCIHVDDYGRIFPSPLRYPSTRVNATYGSWKPFIDRAHAQGIGFGVHLMQGIPKVAVEKKLPIMGSNYTADMIVRGHPPNCASFVPDHWAIDASHPGAQLYYDSVVSNWAEQGLDFVYFDGILDCGFCHIGVVSLLSDSLRRLGNGMYLFTSWGPPSASSGCSFEALSALAPYVRVGSDTVDSFGGSVYNGFSEFTRSVAPSVRPHHFGDLASLMVGKVHCVIINGGHTHNNKVLCPPGPDYYIPSNRSSMTEDEVYSYASMVAIFRSPWWPSGVLTEMNDFEIKLLTNDAVLRVAMMGQDPREVVGSVGPAGSGIVWTSDDSEIQGWKYVLLVNRGTADLLVGVDFEQLGLTPDSSCNVTELWESKSMGHVYQRLTATLRPHVSLFVRLSDCKYQPHPPPHPPPAPSPPTAPMFCAGGNVSACESALQSPSASVATCSADFEHVQRAALPVSAAASADVAGETVHIEALYVDVQGNQHSDLHAVGVLYTDSDGPGELLATSQPVLVSAKSPRSFVRLPFAQPVAVTGVAVWMGEQAGAPPGVKTIPGGPNSLSCYGMPQSAGHEPLRYMPWPFASGPRHTFGPPSNVTISYNSLSIFAVTATSSSKGQGVTSIKSDDSDAIIDLDATAWEFEADPLNVGMSERWWDPDVKAKLERTIRTPGAWQAQGVGNETALMANQFMGVGWYRKNITIEHTNAATPASAWLWIGGAPGGVMRSANVWANGVHTGQHVGYLEPLEMEITKAIGSTGSVLLTVAVDSRWNRTIDPLWGSGSLWNKGGTSSPYDQGGGGDGFSFGGYGGIVGHARLLLRQRVWIEDSIHVQCKPKSGLATPTDTQIAADWACAASFQLLGDVQATDTVDLALCSWNEPSDPCVRVTGNPASSTGRMEIPVIIKNARLWFPGTPERNGRSDQKSLYFANLTVVNGNTVLDLASRRFGVKLVNTDGPRISFNGESVFLSGYGDDGNVYGVSVAPPLDKKFYLSQLTSMRNLGYNFIRFHTHSMPEEFFEAADELGFLCDPEFAMNYGYPTAWGSPVTPAVKEVFNRSFASVVQRLAHHPSIFGWVLSNEIEWPSACLPPAAGPAQHSTATACNATCGAPCSPPQFVELYRYANQFDPTRPCWWSDGVSGMSPGLTCRNGADSADKYCFADMMVAQSGWGHTQNVQIEHGSGLGPTWSEMPVPYILHEAYDGRTFPRLLTNLAAYEVGGMFKADVWLNSSIDKMQQLGLLEENDLWSYASELEYTMRLKNFVESYRLDNAVSGFEWWLGFDWLGSSNGIIGGHEEAWRPKPGIDNETMRTVHASVVLLARDHVTLQSTGVYPSQTVTVELLLSNWTFGGFPSWNSAAQIEWTVQIETSDGDSKQPTSNGSHPLTAHMVPQGQTQMVANISFQIPAVATASKIALHAHLKIGESVAASNVWRIPAFPHPVAPRHCVVPVFADAQLVNAARQICSNAQEVSSTQPFVTPPTPFVMVTDNLRSDVAAAVHHTGGVALILNVPEGNFPVCAVSPIGTIPSFTHFAGQTWWFVAGQVGTVVYNTTLTKALGDASRQQFMDMGFTSVVESAQGFTLDDVNETMVHVRSIPSNIQAASIVTEIHDNALVWERPFPAADYGVSDPDGPSGPGRLIVSGLNIFDAKQPGQLRAGEPQTEFVFRSLLEYAMHQTKPAGSSSEQAITREKPPQQTPPSPLCSKVESFCEAGSTFACSAIAHQVSPSICNGDFACIQPSSLLNSTIDFSQPGKTDLDAIWVFVRPNDARNKDSQIRGLLYTSPSLTGPKTLIANGSSVSPFLNWTFNGLDPVGAATWVKLPMPTIQLPSKGMSSEIVFWAGMVASKDCTCFGRARGASSPPLGPSAPDAYVKIADGAPIGSWTPGGGSISSFVTVKGS